MSTPLSQMSELDVLWSNVCTLKRITENIERRKLVSLPHYREMRASYAAAADAFNTFVQSMRTDTHV